MRRKEVGRWGRTGVAVAPVVLLPLLLVASVGCDTAAAGDGVAAEWAGERAPGQVSDPVNGVGDDGTEASPPGLAVVRSEPVVGRLGPGGEPFEVAVHTPDRPGHERMFGMKSFRISLRGRPSTGEACGSCHRPGRPVIQAERIEDAHRYVLPRHPEESGTHCSTCHAPDDVQSLVLASGERISLEHAYRLCAQCHYAQADDWAAGTHGKRLEGWRGRRVVMSCPDCHDPHQPAIASRNPYPGPRLPTSGGDTP